MTPSAGQHGSSRERSLLGYTGNSPASPVCLRNGWGVVPGSWDNCLARGVRKMLMYSVLVFICVFPPKRGEIEQCPQPPTRICLLEDPSFLGGLQSRPNPAENISAKRALLRFAPSTVSTPQLAILPVFLRPKRGQTSAGH